MQTQQNLTGYPSIDKPWLKYYPGDLIPERKKFSRILDKLKDVWTNPDETIINYYDTEIKAGDFFNRVYEVAKSLAALGMKKGDAIVASLESVPEYIELLLACEMIGCSIKNYFGDAEQIIRLINADDTVKLYIAPDYLCPADTASIYAATNIKNIILIDPLFSVQDKQGLRNNIAEVIQSKYGTGKSNDTRTMSWDIFLEKGSKIDSITINEQNSIRLFSAYTSGSMGEPKEVIHSSESVLGIIDQMCLFPFCEKKRDTWFHTIVPPCIVAVIIAAMCYPLADGKTLILDPYCRLEDVDVEMIHYKPNGWALFPVVIDVLLESDRIPKDYDMSHFKHIGFGAEPLTIKCIERIVFFLNRHNYKGDFNASYGQSEGGSGFTTTFGKEMLVSGSYGIPYIDTTISIFEPNTTNELTYNEIGEICKSGPGLMLGYSDQEMTNEVLKKHSDGKIWLHTGDTGYMTEDGLLFVLGRKGIRVSTDKVVFPLEIENKFASVDGVKDVVAVSGKNREHEELEALYLFIVPEKGISESELLEKVNGFIDTKLPPEQKPKEVFIIDKKPISRFKVDRRALQQKYNLC